LTWHYIPELYVGIISILFGYRDRICGLVFRVSGYIQIQRFWVRFPALPDFLRSSGSGTGSLSLLRTTEELLGRKSSGSGQENRD
jgi:hypothetical protein